MQLLQIAKNAGRGWNKISQPGFPQAPLMQSLPVLEYQDLFPDPLMFLPL